MQPPFADRPAFERQVSVATLADSVVSLARALGERGMGGGDLQTLLATSVRAECVCCGIAVTGAELAEAAVRSAEKAGTGKLNRLRLGYCARASCNSSFYRMQCSHHPAVDWENLWNAVQGTPSTAPIQTQTTPVTAVTRVLIPEVGRSVMQHSRTWLQRPLALGIILLLGGGVFARSGCRVPGLSPKPRTFLVTGEPARSTTTTNVTSRFVAQ